VENSSAGNNHCISPIVSIGFVFRYQEKWSTTKMSTCTLSHNKVNIKWPNSTGWFFGRSFFLVSFSTLGYLLFFKIFLVNIHRHYASNSPLSNQGWYIDTC
jgi:hypothetical protein